MRTAIVIGCLNLILTLVILYRITRPTGGETEAAPLDPGSGVVVKNRFKRKPIARNERDEWAIERGIKR